ncbi:hypothetical protein [Photorhabdus bodei]|uniref:hypothetical protein n=1 Tax=Photorhabdus bodei TaxID=2029681 RepID=UPI00142DBB99|nr:hypothetical protein [Photorhabdus bodei]
MVLIYTLWISSCIATARERIPGSIDNYVTGVRECSQQRGSLKDDGYSSFFPSAGVMWSCCWWFLTFCHYSFLIVSFSLSVLLI